MKLVLFTLALLGVALTVWVRSSPPAIAAHALRSASEARSPGDTVVISMLYSPEKKGWIEWARDEYVRDNPLVQVKLASMGSTASVDAILLGHEKPVIWSPESRLELGDLSERWLRQTGRSLYARGAEFAPESLVQTVLVLIAWESRAKVLDEFSSQPGGADPRLWKRLVEATASPEGWRALGGPAEWGRVKFAYTDPLQTSSGLWTLYLACLDELNGSSEIGAEQLDDPGVVELLRAAASSPLASLADGRDLVKQMEQFGPSRYDLAVTYESLALQALDTPKERWEGLVIYYPPRWVWSDHPAVVLDLEETTDEQKAAALHWIQFLKSHPVQLEAIRHGFRPADPSVSLSEFTQHNPFVAHLTQVIERLDIERSAPVPDGAVVERLLSTWRDDRSRQGVKSAQFFGAR